VRAPGFFLMERRKEKEGEEENECNNRKLCIMPAVLVFFFCWFKSYGSLFSLCCSLFFSLVLDTPTLFPLSSFSFQF